MCGSHLYIEAPPLARGINGLAHGGELVRRTYTGETHVVAWTKLLNRIHPACLVRRTPIAWQGGLMA